MAIGDELEMTFRRLYTGAGSSQLLLEGAPAALTRDSRRKSWRSNGIKDQVAIVGMGCTPFGEHWDKGADDLLVDAATDAYASAQASSPTRSTPTGSAPWAAASRA